MKRIAIAALAAACSLGAQARCITNWPWQIPTEHDRQTQYLHKLGHTAGSALVTAGVAWATDDVRLGVLAGISVGAARELYKKNTPGMSCEWSSMTFDAVGVALGAHAASRWLVIPRHDGVVVSYSAHF